MDQDHPLCPSCQTLVPADALACAQCGSAVQAVSDECEVPLDAEPVQGVVDGEAGTLPLDDPEVVQCLRCTALLPCYARYCLHCGALQEALSATADESAVLDEVPAEPAAQEVHAAAPSLPETVLSVEPSIVQAIRAQQRRVAQHLLPLESSRDWWRKYF